MRAPKLIVHLIVLLYLSISIVHQVYYDQAYKVLGIKGSIEFARAWPVVGLFLIFTLWGLWLLSSWRLKRRQQQVAATNSQTSPHIATPQPQDAPAPKASSYTTDDDYVGHK